MATSEQRTILVTGATDGLGKGVAMELARAGATVLVHGRDQTRLRNTVDEIRHVARGAKLRVYCADFASLGEVRRLADAVLARESRLDVLVNNAGIGATVPDGPERRESGDGLELRFAVNYLAPFLLTRLLLPLLARSVPSRIVNVSSIGQQAIDFDDVMLERDYNGMRAYRQSKLAQIMFTIDLQAQLEGSGIGVTTLHPATFMPTKIVPSPISTLEEGIGATMRAIDEPEAAAVNGKFFDGVRERKADPQAYDAEARQRLRVLSEQLTHAPAVQVA